MFLEGFRVAPILPTLLRGRGIADFILRGELFAITRLSHRAEPPKPGVLRAKGDHLW